MSEGMEATSSGFHGSWPLRSAPLTRPAMMPTGMAARSQSGAGVGTPVANPTNGGDVLGCRPIGTALVVEGATPEDGAKPSFFVLPNDAVISFAASSAACVLNDDGAFVSAAAAVSFVVVSSSLSAEAFLVASASSRGGAGAGAEKPDDLGLSAAALRRVPMVSAEKTCLEPHRLTTLRIFSRSPSDGAASQATRTIVGSDARHPARKGSSCVELKKTSFSK
mmetsp:Transcript_18670/g.57424  ORF Transcript_18670/g.57424 Transcript_18670/m.57424 type:complete len:222 (-) Transcript_18670:235-900(-)